jgi:hypothetical protein
MKCSDCKHWIKGENERVWDQMRKCKILSGTIIKNAEAYNGRKYDKEVYPDLDKTGVLSIALCEHDGGGFNYFTKGWFGCIHFKKTKIKHEK